MSTLPLFYANTEYVAGQHIFKTILDGSDKLLTDLALAPTCNVMTIQNGTVGIGTTNPTAALHVVGNVLASGTITASNISVIGDFVTLNTITSNSEQMVITNNGTGPALKVTQTGDNSVAEFYDNESGIALFVGNGGNVGVGTTIATSLLTINGLTTVNTNTPSVTWISGHSNYNYTIAGNSYNTSNNGSRLPYLAPMAIVNNGDLYIWGSNLYGQLNNGSSNITIVQPTPLKNNLGDLANKKIVAVAGSLYHSAALDDDGALYTWGNNAAGQLGIAGLPSGALVQSSNVYTACNISAYGSLLNKKITAVSCGPYSTLALDSTGQVHAWGSNYGGTLGFSNIVPSYVSIACNISSYGSLNGITIVAIQKDDSYASMALDNTGQVHIWGDNNFGKLGFGSTIPRNVTAACNISVYGSLNGRTITAIAAGGSHYIALDNVGQVHTWGCNYSGQLGFGASPLVYATRSCNISVYGSLNGRTIASINAGTATSYAIDTTGQLHGWGNNSNGELGLGITTLTQRIPINISAYTSGSLNTQSLSSLSTTYLGGYGFDVRGNLHTLGVGYNGIGTTITAQVISSIVPTFKKNKIYISDNTINFDGAKISSDNNLSGIVINDGAAFPSPLGNAPLYACRAWVNFDGTLSGIIIPRSNGNISRVIKNGLGDYTLYFDIPMPSVNFIMSGSVMTSLLTNTTLSDHVIRYEMGSQTSVRIQTGFYSNTNVQSLRDCVVVMVNIFH